MDVAVPGALQAQPRPAQIRGSIGLGAFVEADTHTIAGASWRKHLGTRGWGFEVEGLTMRANRPNRSLKRTSGKCVNPEIDVVNWGGSESIGVDVGPA